ncbi:uroporphyrinogen-III synthase [Shimia thalassica]|uniref:Uroporphyrinogen-III synthase n=1 Tax=Shimia thalassica TaxID=1715693 RepID=A0A0P1IFE4_9RHOB|nr:uroporphyrinogen-III synthase [Shimia thalassica]
MNPQVPTIVLTRPLGASERFADQLRVSGVNLPIAISPVLEIVPTGFTLPERFSGAIFTSTNGVAAVQGHDLPAWCVGDRTTREARLKGWRAFSADGDVEALLSLILQDAPKGPLVHFRGVHSTGDLAQRLTSKGIETSEAVVYRQEQALLNVEAKQLLMGKHPVILPLFSPKSAATIAEQGPFHAPVAVVAISAAVADAARSIASKGLLISRAPDAKAMVAAINHVADAACFVEDGANTA